LEEISEGELMASDKLKKHFEKVDFEARVKAAVAQYEDTLLDELDFIKTELADEFSKANLTGITSLLSPDEIKNVVKYNEGE